MDVVTQIRNLAAKVPMNELGLPISIYRADMLPAYPVFDATAPVNGSQSLLGVPDNTNELGIIEIDESPATVSPEAKETANTIAVPSSATKHPLPVLTRSPQELIMQYERDVRVALCRLEYAEGYPTLDGAPFWAQLPFEPAEAFVYFQAYLSQYKQGARQVIAVLDDPLVKNVPSISLDHLNECYHIYYWGARCKAHDMFFAAHRRKEREYRAMETEDEHFLQASRLMGIVSAYFEANGEELIETMTPKAALEMFKIAMQAQRISVGLPANGGNSASDHNPGQTLELTMRSISQQSRKGISEEITAESAENIENNDQKRLNLSEILQNPDMVKSAQELIIKLTQPSRNDHGGF